MRRAWILTKQSLLLKKKKKWPGYGQVRLGARVFSYWLCARISDITQTWSPVNASRQTYPCLQVSAPYVTVASREAAAALSAWAWVCDAGGTQILSAGPASRYKNPSLQVPLISQVLPLHDCEHPFPIPGIVRTYRYTVGARSVSARILFQMLWNSVLRFRKLWSCDFQEPSHSGVYRIGRIQYHNFHPFFWRGLHSAGHYTSM